MSKLVLSRYPIVWLKEIDKMLENKYLDKLLLKKIAYYLKYYLQDDDYNEAYIEPLRIGFLNLMEYYEGNEYQTITKIYNSIRPNFIGRYEEEIPQERMIRNYKYYLRKRCMLYEINEKDRS